MRKPAYVLAAALLLGLGASSVFVGCAGTATQHSTGEAIDNASITAKVKAALLNDPGVSGLAVNVETFRGTVQLSGFVDNAAQKQRAEEIARSVQGVQTIDNKITVK